nr:AMP-binding protein [Bacillus subtilis]
MEGKIAACADRQNGSSAIRRDCPAPQRPPGCHIQRYQSWTYGELNAKANRLARILIDCGISPDDRVGVLTKPSLEMSAAVLGVLKAGAAFVPIDPDYPDQRIEYILQDSGAKLLLKQECISVPDSFSGDVILLDGSRTILSLPLDENDEENPETAVTAENLAYMIYTSGTTGQPKGVMVEHHALVNLCFWHHDAFSMTAEDRSAKYAGFGFDASIWEMFPTWTIGAELHVIDEAIRLDIVRLNDYFETNGVTITFLPTQLAEQFMELENTSLRVLLTGGDKLKRAVKKPYTLVNNYGRQKIRSLPQAQKSIRRKARFPSDEYCQYESIHSRRGQSGAAGRRSRRALRGGARTGARLSE